MAVKTYKYNENVQLSAHFNSKEFRCKCGKEHDILIDSDLIDKLEQLHSELKCHSIVINSGYRCYNHDKNVGGTGTGKHTTGMAADIVCYEVVSNNKLRISSKIVSCKAQDIGFGGIANINNAYTSTHVDTRTGSKYYGDETKGYSSVTKDFYEYYNIENPNKINEEEKSEEISDKKEEIVTESKYPKKYLTESELKELISTLKDTRDNLNIKIDQFVELLSKD